MNQQRRFRHFALAGILIATMGCQTIESYDIAISNEGASIVTDAHVTYGKFRSVGGRLIPGSCKTHLAPNYAIPEVAIVRWRDKDGLLHESEVEVKKHVPSGFRGTLGFGIGEGDTVDLEVVPR